MAHSRVTVHDVARLAGLSTSSVSRALSGARPVSADVAERARRAAEQLEYRPDSVARSLRTQQTKTLGLVIADVTNPFFPLLIQAVEMACREAGLSLLLADAQNDVDIEAKSVQLLIDKRVDALLISPSHRFLSRSTIEAAAQSVRVVQLDRVADHRSSFVRVDQARGVDLVVEHLQHQGRRQLGFIGSDPSVATSWERQEAFVESASRLDPRAPLRVLAGEFSVDWGRQACAQLLEAWPEVDGIVCANDLIALGAQQALVATSVAVPEQVAVVGFDDTIIASAGQLTSVRQPLADLARRAVTFCEQNNQRTEAPEQATLEPELMVRASSTI